MMFPQLTLIIDFLSKSKVGFLTKRSSHREAGLWLRAGTRSDLDVPPHPFFLADDRGPSVAVGTLDVFLRNKKEYKLIDQNKRWGLTCIGLHGMSEEFYYSRGLVAVAI